MSDAPDDRVYREPTLGDLLREAREERGLELSEVASITNVRREYLQWLEEGRYADLPEDVYTRNFLRLFAQAVGLDVVTAQEIYRSERRDAMGVDTMESRLERDREIAADVPPLSESGRWWETPERGFRWGPLLSTVLMVGAIVGLALWGFNSTLFQPSRGTTASAPREPAEEAAAVRGETAGAEVAAQPAEAGLPRTVRLSVTSQPPGAEVSVDEFPLPGTTPIVGAPVTARPSRTIRLSLEGYEPFEGEFDLTFDRNLSVALTPLRDEPPAVAAGPGQAPQGAPPGVATAEAQTTPAGAADSPVVLNITEDTWLEVYSGTARNQGQRLAFTTARAGQTLRFPLPVYIHVGNAGGVELVVDGQSRGLLGSSGEVLGLAVAQ